MIDEVQLYDVSLNEAEVENLFNSFTTTNGVPITWFIENGLDPSEALSLVDLDGDGQRNELEYFFGTNPRENDSPFGPLSVSDGEFSFDYTRRKLDDVTITAEWSRDLTESSWSTMELTEAVQSESGGIETVRVTVAQDEERKFIRIRVGDDTITN